MTPLPIHAVLPDLLAALRGEASAVPNAVLVAPPGAGKTTAVAPALLAEPWCSGTVLMLSPRRVAARAAAERMAEMLGEAPGQTIGYLTRLDSKRSGKTRVLVMTEAIFVATILGDPELTGISAVLFDEAHERHLDSDLGLALAIETQAVLRPDLRMVVMSATLDGARFAALLADAPVIESEGRAWPLAIKWLGGQAEARVEDQVASAVLIAWREESGDILAFLPGVREIERTQERLADKLPQALVLPLHGQVEPAGQRAAIRRDPAKNGQAGRRRIVLATAIAETSLTLDGVSVVIDAGLSRRAEFDVAAGVTRLVTTRASRAAAAQRAGRGARQGPGVAYRLWEEAGHAGRAAFDPPEMLAADLAPLALTLARWGAHDARALAWLDPPPAPALAAAQAQLQALGALDAEQRITPHGHSMAALPMDPPLAHMLLYAAQHGAADRAAKLALLLQERGLGGRSDDLAARLDRWDAERGARADASRKLADRWARAADQSVGKPHDREPPPLAVLLAEAFPDRIAKSRSASGEDWLAAGGRGYRLDPASPLGRAGWLVIGDAQGQASGARILAGLALEEDHIARWLGHRITARHTLTWNAEGARPNARIEARLERRLGAITMARVPDPSPDPAAVMALLLDRLRDQGMGALPLGDAAKALIARATYAGLEALGGTALMADLDHWLGPLLAKRRDLAIPPGALHEALLGRLGWTERQQLDTLAPANFISPLGTTHAIDYAHEGGPAVELRVQALFGLDRHPTIGRPPRALLLSLTSPGGRPIQLTTDLPAFWRGSWKDVVKDMKGRYPRHRWPDEPWAEDPSLKTRNAFERFRTKSP